jgi:hypothetical protein
MENVSQLHAPTALPPVLYALEARMLRMESTPPQNFLPVVSRVSIKNEGTREINYGNCIAASRPDRITPGTHEIGGSNDINGVYPPT